ncbi:multiple epidermal growth factor-like domains protein 9 isoform X2 [Hemibagrus wyckioides]|uniref:multiple epidermal growth factor-like domains protein 9 isoform X2 n=1 Tax=Hemibagrus wyckioides TaxID=337641 RepID=UPI00266BF125|nr:multiple epidermal growth factor-like domains protein 9 isoform X2 [Hemibagrus wyckioides]
MVMMVMMMMSASPAFSLIALACLGWSCAHDAVRKPRQILSSGDANPQSGFTGLTPAPTVLTAEAQTTSSIQPPTSDPSSPSPEHLREDAAVLMELHQPRAERLLAQRRQSSVSDKAQDAGVITTSDNSQELVCNCSTEGVLDPDECDRDTGQCVCMAGYTGLQCEECEEDHFSNGTVGCLPCGCDSHGAVGLGCDSSGTCVCKTGVYGPKCDDCHPGFFHFSSSGCQPCQCNGHSTYCHPQSGVCMDCQDNTQGHNCEECVPRYYRAPGGGVMDECLPCPCPSHSSTGTCHLASRTFPNPTRTSITTSPQGSTSAPPSSLLFTSSPSKAPPLQSGSGDPTASNSTASALAVVSWTQFNVIVLAVIIVLLVLLMGFVGAVYTYREYRNRKLNAPFWTIELKEDNISFSSYHDSIPHAEPGVLLEEEQCSAPSNGQLALAPAANVFKA